MLFNCYLKAIVLFLYKITSISSLNIVKKIIFLGKINEMIATYKHLLQI